MSRDQRYDTDPLQCSSLLQEARSDLSYFWDLHCQPRPNWDFQMDLSELKKTELIWVEFVITAKQNKGKGEAC